jgi:hypothetical protein
MCSSCVMAAATAQVVCCSGWSCQGMHASATQGLLQLLQLHAIISEQAVVTYPMIACNGCTFIRCCCHCC